MEKRGNKASAPPPGSGQLTPQVIQDYRAKLTHGEDVIDPETWGGNSSCVGNCPAVADRYQPMVQRGVARSDREDEPIPDEGLLFADREILQTASGQSGKGGAPASPDSVWTRHIETEESLAWLVLRDLELHPGAYQPQARA